MIVQFELQHCARRPLHKCSESEVRRVSYAKYFMSGAQTMVFCEPVLGVDVRTIQTFINMLQKLKEQQCAVLVLVSGMEHALLLGDTAYKLQPAGMRRIEVVEEEMEEAEADSPIPKTAKLFKIPAKVDDKIILFNPRRLTTLKAGTGRLLLSLTMNRMRWIPHLLTSKRSWRSTDSTAATAPIS